MNIIQRPADPSNYAKGRRHTIDQITYHHIVGNAPGGTDHFRTPGTDVSSTYAIAADGTIYQYVAESDTPYTDANSLSNSRAITIEHAGPPYAEPMYQASIALCRDIQSRHNITRFMRHRDVSDKPTACPGALDVERIIRESKQQGGTDMATNQQIDQWISLFHQEAYGKPPTDAVFNSWRPLLKNSFTDGSLSIMIGTDTNAGALKNQPKGGGGDYTPVNETLYRRK